MIIPLLLFLISCFALASSYYFQYVKGLLPCLLCLVQRYCFLILSVLLLILLIQRPGSEGIAIYGIIILFPIVLGGLAALRQVWIQHFPSSAEATCIPNLKYLVETFPLLKVLKDIEEGGEDCTKITWSFLKLSMADWSLFLFILLGVIDVLFLI